MESKKLCCGPHVSLQKTLYETVKANTSPNTSSNTSSNPLGSCQCVQCFLGSPTQYVIRKFSDEDLHNTGDYLRKNNHKLYVHAPYIINLAHNSEEKMVEKGSECLSNILNTLSRVDNERTRTVLHIGANGTIANVVKHLNDLEIKSPLFLENCAGEGTKLGKNIEELRKLKEGIDSHRVGFCLDTCHCHASGMCDMRSSESIIKMFDDLDSKRVMIHLNDSLEDFGKKKDRHAILGLGKIWDINKIESFESLSTLRNYSREYGIDMILETPSSNIKDYELKLLE